MFTNIGNKIRTFAKVLCIIGIVLAALSGLIMMISGISMLGYSYTAGAGVALIFGGLVSAALGALLAWVGSFVLYGYGQLIHSVQQIEKKVLGSEYQDFDKQPNISPFSGMNNAAPATPVAPVAPVQPIQPAQPEQPTAPEQPAQPEQSDVKVCSKCNYVNAPTATFCVGCGNRLD